MVNIHAQMMLPATPQRTALAGIIIWAWILTIPASAFVAAVAYWISLQLF